jgi:hypothetical protein
LLSHNPIKGYHLFDFRKPNISIVHQKYQNTHGKIKKLKVKDQQEIDVVGLIL